MMSQKRQLLLDTAIRLFAQYGYHGTGIDRIAEQAQVSKKTMYHYFRSKDELILAALKEYDSLFRNDFMKSVDRRGNTPYERLLAIFDVAGEWFSGGNFFGCMFINVIGEYSDADSAIRTVCKEHKRLMTHYIEELATKAGVADAHNVATSIAILLEGAIVTAQVHGSPGTAAAARAAAKVLLDNALASTEPDRLRNDHALR